MNLLLSILNSAWLVFGQMAPYLLFGFLAGGLLSVFLSPAWVGRHLGGTGMLPVFKASLFGVPLPLCSCSVIPVGASIRRQGASRAATTAFLLSTPQTGVDSILATYALLGPVFAVVRPLAALVTGMVGGGLVLVGAPERTAATPPADAGPTPGADAGAGRESPDPQAPALQRALGYGFGVLPRDIGPALFVGVLITGVMTVLLPPGRLEAALGGGIVAILILMAVGVPLYVCATASVPIAVGLMHLGASPGAALAFLIAGPATNAATFTTIWKILGRTTALLYILTVGASAVGFGLLLDAFGTWGAMPAAAESHAHAHAAASVFTVNSVSAVILAGVLVVAFLAPRLRRARRAANRPAANASASLILRIKGMTCAHCAESVHNTLLAGAGVGHVQVDLPTGIARVDGNALCADALVQAVTRAGYAATLASERVADASDTAP